MTIDNVWKSSSNTLPPVAQHAVLAETRAELRRIQRRRTTFVVSTGTALVAISGAIAYAVATWSSGSMAGAAPALLLLLAQWWAFALFVRDMLAGGRATSADATIRESLERLWREADTSRRRQLTVLCLYAVAVPLISAALVEMRHAGKMAPHEALSAAILFGAVITVGTTVILVNRYARILPRRRRLAELLAQYRSE
jgi:hypothetical protein